VKWRDFWDFGCGALGDFGCHDLDSVTWAFNLETPESVEVLPAGNKGAKDIAPYGETGCFRFAEKGDQKAIKLYWYSAGLKPFQHELLPKDYKMAGRGAIFIGEKGILINNGGSWGVPEIFPEKLRESFTPPPQTIPRSKGHHREWIDAIKGGPAAMSNFDYASRLTEITLLGVLSLRMGGKIIYWDAENLKATGLPEADKFIQEPVRAGWEMD
jgi:predicted dehydrogenase